MSYAEELRAAQARLDLLQGALPIAFYTLDARGEAVTSVGAAIEGLTGFPTARWTSEPGLWASRLHPEDAARARLERAAVLERGTSTSEYRWLRADGTYGSIQDRAVLLRGADGAPEEVAGVWIDATTRRAAGASPRELEDKDRQSQKMEAIGRLAGGVAHDFNNLLTAILGYSDLLLQGVAPDFPLRSELEEVKRAAERAAALTGQLLAFSRRQPTNPRSLDLNAMVKGIEKMLRRIIPESIRLEFKPGPGLGSIRADPGQLDQIIMNLALNARDAMPEGGALLISTAAVETDAGAREGKTGSYAVLTVADTGSGIPKDMLPHLFEPFFTTKGEGKGTGLGLATVYGIAQQSGGFVTVDSDEGRGTTFKVYLPRLEGAPPVRSETSIARAVTGTETVLLVDDDAVVRALVRRCLAMNGYRVVEASSPWEAAALHEKSDVPVDLLLTDMVMPGMSGRELAGRLRSAHPNLKVLFMSGYTDETGLNFEADGTDSRMIAKPFLPQALLLRVRNALSK